MATLTPKRPGQALTYAAAAAGGDEFANSGREVLHVRNAGASACVVTLTSQRACNQGVVHNETHTVAAGADLLIAAVDPRRFNNSSGRVEVEYDQVDSVTVAVLDF